MEIGITLLDKNNYLKYHHLNFNLSSIFLICFHK